MNHSKFVSHLLTCCIPSKNLRKNLRKKVKFYFDKKENVKKFLSFQKRYDQNILKIKEKVKNKEKIKVCFIGYADGASCDVFTSLYRLFSQDNKFETSVIIMPYSHDSKENMIKLQNESMEYLKSLNIPAEFGFNVSTHLFNNHYDEYDLVFFEIDYDWVVHEFSVSNFPSALTFYISYGQFLADNIEGHFSQKMLSEVFCIYPPAKNIKEMMKKYSLVKGKNINSEFLGNPKTELFFDKNYHPVDVWKVQKSKVKRIIWAPHHLWANYSNFLQYKDFFIELAQKYQQKIQFAFKPHPALKESLLEKAGWSQKEVDDYYHLWETMPNTQLETGAWTDLFLTSDAMIMDSIGFMLEYSLTGKPSCVQYREDNQKQRIMKFSDCGEELFNLLYHSKNENEIVSFIENVVLENKDDKRQERMTYIQENYLPPFGKTASQNIYDDIKRKVGL